MNRQTPLSHTTEDHAGTSGNPTIGRIRGNRRLLVSLALLLIVGAPLAWWLVHRAENDLRLELQRNALLISQALDAGSIKLLNFQRDDRALRSFQQVGRQMRQLSSSVRISWSPAGRYVSIYSMKMVNGAIRFGPESIPENHPMASPPGTVYKDPPPELLKVFSTGRPAVVGPYTDEYGTFVCAYVSLPGTTPGPSKTVIGVDVMADSWRLAVLQKSAVPVGLMLVLMIGVAAFLFSKRPVNASPKPVTWRLMPSVSFMLILLVACGGVLLYLQYQQHMLKDIAAETSDVDGDLRSVLNQQSYGLGAALRAIASDPGVQRALREGAANRLTATWQPVFEALKRDYRVTHFYFLDTHRICLLRLHKPEKRGDRIDRFTALEAARTGKTSSGIELGPLGTFTLRVVQPVFEGSALVGYVELGKEIDEVLQELHTRFGSQLAVVIRKEYLSRKTWEAGMRALGRPANWDLMRRGVLSYSSQDRLPDALLSWADQLAADTAHGESNQEFNVDGKLLRTSAVHLSDASGRPVGELLNMRDISTEYAEYMRLATLGGICGAVLLAVLLGGVYVILRRTDSSINAQQEALRQSEQSYRNQFDFNAAVMLLIDPAGGALVDANAAACSFYGYPREQLLSMRIVDINTASASDVLQALTSVQEGQGKWLHFQHRVADGSVRDVEVSASSIQFGGRILRHEIVHDITERKRVESELIATKDSLEAMVSALPDLMFRIDRAGYIHEFNSARADLLYAEPSSFTGKLISDMLPEDAARVIIGALEEAAEQGSHRGATYSLAMPQGVMWFELSIASMGRTTQPADHFIVLVRDITERKRLEGEVRKSETRFREMFEQSPVAYQSLDEQGLFLDANDELCHLLGYSREELLGQSFGAFWTNETRRLFHDTFASFKTAGTTRGELGLIRKDGSHLTAILQGRIQRDYEGRFVRTHCILYDITERKRAEEELISANRKLAALTTRAQDLAVQAESANRSKSEFLANMSHEIRTPMNGIMGMSELLGMTELTDEQIEYLNVIKSSSSGLLALINDILDLSKIEAGKMELDRSDFSLRASINDIIKTQMTLIRSKGLDVRTEIPSSVPDKLCGDQLRLKQTLLNLLGNAIKFTDQGWIRVAVAVIERHDNRVNLQIEVADTGIGISTEAMEKIFKPFTQADTSITRKYAGSGLGLSICMRLAELMGGSLRAESTEGVGSAFYLQLPFDIKGEVPERGDESGDIVRGLWHGPPLNILVADDLETNLTVAMRLLQKTGHTSVGAHNGEEAVEKWRQGAFDAILMDIQMPGMNGIEATREIRAREQETGRHIPVIALTARALPEERDSILSNGFDGYIAKPVEIAALFSELRRCLPDKLHNGPGEGGPSFVKPGASSTLVDREQLARLLNEMETLLQTSNMAAVEKMAELVRALPGSSSVARFKHHVDQCDFDDAMTCVADIYHEFDIAPASHPE